MTSRQINTTLWMASGLFCALAAGVVAWTLLHPVTAEPVAQIPRAIPSTNPTAMANLPSPAASDTLVDKPLRHNFAGSTSSAAAVATTQPASAEPPLVLVGTIGNSLAMLRTREGTIELKAVGESVAGMTIVAIGPSKVEARYNGKLIQLGKERRG